jgi:hypothetical protein
MAVPLIIIMFVLAALSLIFIIKYDRKRLKIVLIFSVPFGLLFDFVSFTHPFDSIVGFIYVFLIGATVPIVAFGLGELVMYFIKRNRKQSVTPVDAKYKEVKK